MPFQYQQHQIQQYHQYQLAASVPVRDRTPVSVPGAPMQSYFAPSSDTTSTANTHTTAANPYDDYSANNKPLDQYPDNLGDDYPATRATSPSDILRGIGSPPSTGSGVAKAGIAEPSRLPMQYNSEIPVPQGSNLYIGAGAHLYSGIAATTHFSNSVHNSSRIGGGGFVSGLAHHGSTGLPWQGTSKPRQMRRTASNPMVYNRSPELATIKEGDRYPFYNGAISPSCLLNENLQSDFGSFDISGALGSMAEPDPPPYDPMMRSLTFRTDGDEQDGQKAEEDDEDEDSSGGVSLAMDTNNAEELEKDLHGTMVDLKNGEDVESVYSEPLAEHVPSQGQVLSNADVALEAGLLRDSITLDKPSKGTKRSRGAKAASKQSTKDAKGSGRSSGVEVHAEPAAVLPTAETSAISQRPEKRAKKNHGSSATTNPGKSWTALSSLGNPNQASPTPPKPPQPVPAMVFETPDKLKAHIKREHHRFFGCRFSFAGCTETFSTKNEWKRHACSQHVVPEYWFCAHVDCKYAKHFVRKDLFMQHLWRMHTPVELKKERDKPEKSMKKDTQIKSEQTEQTEPAASTSTSTAGGKKRFNAVKKQGSNAGADNSVDIGGRNAATETGTVYASTDSPELKELTRAHERIERASHKVRMSLTAMMVCPVPYCEVTHEGENAWDRNMEHIAGHMQQGSAPMPFGNESDRVHLVPWAVQNGILVSDGGGGWKIVKSPVPSLESMRRDRELRARDAALGVAVAEDAFGEEEDAVDLINVEEAFDETGVQL
ncbi:hypothetical protein SBRCBS47491_006071 [Sporothrix bragantina]|uniref:C2H2-type domain-containing protein n=1 Tax=Sporothrix bragantina TaxID=671064 RepID=A0ABP0C2C1_9PEZI